MTKEVENHLFSCSNGVFVYSFFVLGSVFVGSAAVGLINAVGPQRPLEHARSCSVRPADPRGCLGKTTGGDKSDHTN